MQRTTEQDERMTRYLLGDLPGSEQAAVEQEYFADPERFEEVWSAENDLVDRYARGRLSRGERELFEHTSNDCEYGHTCTTTGDNLPDADGRDVTSIQLHYKYKTTAVGSNWSDLVHTPNQPTVASPKCYDGKTYGDGSKGFYIPPQ